MLNFFLLEPLATLNPSMIYVFKVAILEPRRQAYWLENGLTRYEIFYL